MTTDLQRFAEWDWLDSPRATVLHHAERGEWDDDEWEVRWVTYTCGRGVPRAYIPGVLTRMGLKRCDRCCDRLGYPRGIGSPKNDPACRPILDPRMKLT